jgi:hypothetical protein
MNDAHTPVSAHGSDRRAAYTGLIVGAIVLFAILFSIVLLTNRHYEQLEAAAAPTAAPAAAPAPAPTH